MDRSEYRDEEEDESPPDAYWRRRVITLALGLGLLGILAWGFSGGGAKNQPASSSSSLLPATALGTAVPGLPSTMASHPATPTAATPTPTASPSPSPSVSRTPSTPPHPSARPGASAPAAASAQTQLGPGGQCPAGSVVLSLFTDRPSYTAGEYPQFQVYAVSTYAGSCQFNPGQLQVNVMSEGRIIWDSSDCSRGSDAHVAELARGVPAQAAVVWNRTITLPGCQVLATNARDGWYQVQARTNTVTSPIRAFKLTG
jgi:hypothetical protein